jgi:hypothetical protein
MVLQLRAARALRWRGNTRRLLGFSQLASFGQNARQAIGIVLAACMVELPDGACAATTARSASSMPLMARRSRSAQLAR